MCSATTDVYTVKCIRTQGVHTCLKKYLIGAGHRPATLRPVLDSPWSQRQTVPLLSHNTRNTVKCIMTDRDSIHASKEYLTGAGHRSAVLRPVLGSPWSQRQNGAVLHCPHSTAQCGPTCLQPLAPVCLCRDGRPGALCRSWSPADRFVSVTCRQVNMPALVSCK